MTNMLFTLGCLVPVTICGYTDIKTGLIYNKITIPTLIVGFAYAAYASRLQDAAIGFAIGFFVFLVAAIMGGVGGGDVKLAAALGAWYGFSIVYVILIASVFCIVWGGYKLCKRGQLTARMSVFFKGIFYRFIYGMKGVFVMPQLPDKDEPLSDDVVPYGVCIALASWIVFFALFR